MLKTRLVVRALTTGVVGRMTSFPTLTKELDFNVWKLQYESATKAKIYSKLGEDDKENEKVLSNFRLSGLPSALHEEILFGCADKFSVGTTTYKTAVQAVREQWIRITRPTDISAEMYEIKIKCNDDVIPAWQRFLRLKYYTTISDDFLCQLLVNCVSDPVTKQNLQSFIFGKTLSPQQIVDFFTSLTFGTQSSAETHEAVCATKLRCSYCNRGGHLAKNCWKRRRESRQNNLDNSDSKN